MRILPPVHLRAVDMDPLKRLVTTGLVLLGLALAVAPTAAQQVSEADVKAAYLFNFTRFVDWPEGTLTDAHPFVLCVVADSSMTALIEKTMQGEEVKGRPNQTIVPASVEDARKCQILFVGRTEAARARALLAGVRDRPVLTVSDAARFAASGGMIQFIREDEHVRFIVNVEAARRSRIAISSRLLRVAASIEGAPK